MAIDQSSALKRLRPLVTNPSATFTRPADTTTYASGDLVANSTTAGSVTPMSFTICSVAGGQAFIRRATLRKTTTANATVAAFRLHLFKSSPTVANGDNGAISIAGSANYIGSISFGSALTVFSDGCVNQGVPSVGPEFAVDLTGTNTVIYGLLEAQAAYIPGNAEQFTVTLDCVEQQ